MPVIRLLEPIRRTVQIKPRDLPTEAPETYTRAHVLDKLGISWRTALRWMDDPKIALPRPKRIAGKAWLFSRADFDAWLIRRFCG